MTEWELYYYHFNVLDNISDLREKKTQKLERVLGITLLLWQQMDGNW